MKNKISLKDLEKVVGGGKLGQTDMFTTGKVGKEKDHWRNGNAAGSGTPGVPQNTP